MCFKLFANTLALPSQEQNNSWWESGDCIKQRPIGAITQVLFSSQNKPSTCITYCKAEGFKFAAVNNIECFCGNGLDPEGQVGINICHTPCPGLLDSVCGGGTLWWNVFSANGNTYS